ncbi:DUF2510 domain-containing protein [Mycobacterium sp. GA-1285]|uniref:DUF2510 domain-containing protein n=1 Tax=Mycobacterium sp. GA-1285 TaxID=1772282 RepID=UPI0020A2A5F1|nr:DUF2510 domain-containing protein [Mycobacterium sp. GA-1285]
MAAIAGQAAPDEALVDLMHVTGYSTAGFSGFNAKVLLLVATDRRIWFCRHGKGSIKVLQPLDYGAITIEQKRVFLGWPKLDGTTITCDGSTAEWLTSLRSGHRQPAPWLQPTQPAGTIPSQPAPANWYPDPYRRSELRYWDGSRWTPHVSTNGITAQDPIGQ